MRAASAHSHSPPASTTRERARRAEYVQHHPTLGDVQGSWLNLAFLLAALTAGGESGLHAIRWRRLGLYRAILCLPLGHNVRTAVPQESCFVAHSHSLSCSLCPCRHRRCGRHCVRSPLTLLPPFRAVVRSTSPRDPLRSSSSAESQTGMCLVRGRTS